MKKTPLQESRRQPIKPINEMSAKGLASTAQV